MEKKKKDKKERKEKHRVRDDNSNASNSESKQSSSRRDSKESSNGDPAVEGIDPPGFFIEEKGAHTKAMKELEESSTLSGFQPKPKKNKKKPDGEHTKVKNELFKSVQEVEERLKTREQYKLVIHKIELSKLISAHRLLKNQPWVRAAYGQTVTWTLPSPQRLQEDKKTERTAFEHVRSSCNSEGSAADWSGVDWSFNIERNEVDRLDFVLAVCSRDVVLGRYVLNRDDLTELLNQQLAEKSSADGQMFLVEGDVLNDLGKSGRINLVCRVLPADKPSGVNQSPISSPNTDRSRVDNKKENSPVAETKHNHTHSDSEQEENSSDARGEINGEKEESVGDEMIGTKTVGIAMKGNEYVIENDNDAELAGMMAQSTVMELVQEEVDADIISRAFVTLRILGAAVMDLKSVHMFEPNSPVLSIESDSWHSQTEARRQSGMAAKWTGLFWKVTVRRDVGMLVSVTSLDKLIGRALLTTEELLSSPAVKLPNLPNQSQVKVHQLVKTLSSGSDYTGRVKINMIVNHPDDVVDALQIYSNDSLAQVQQHAMMHPTGSPQQHMFRPFQVMVREAVALEIAVPAWLRLLRPGSRIPITLHCAAGSWAQSTSVVLSDGKLAHWLALGWAVPLLNEASAMRLTLWCGDVSVGATSLSPQELRTVLLHNGSSNPGDGNHSGEVLTQLRDARGHVAAKLKLHCRCDMLPVACDGTLLSRPQSATNALLQSGNKRPVSALSSIRESPVPVSEKQHPHLSQQQQHSSSSLPNLRSLSPGVYVPGEHNRNQQQKQALLDSANPFLAPTHFPILVTFVEMSLVDLLVPTSMLGALPAFLANPSGPVLLLLCDRQSLSTASLHASAHNQFYSTYNQQSMRWNHLPAKQWTVRIRNDSTFSLALSMRRGQHIQPVGKAQLQPVDQLLGLPVDYDGFAQLTIPIRNPEDDVVGRVVLRMIIRSADVSENTVNGNSLEMQDSLFAISMLGEHKNEVATERARLRIEDMQRKAKADVGRLRQEAQQMPVMPWNQHQQQQQQFGPDGLRSDEAWQPTASFAQNQLVGQQGSQFSHKLDSSNNNNGNKTIVFDPRHVFDAAESLRHDLQFRVCIDEIDLWELRKVHRLKRNDPRVAAASGKWTATTIAASQIRAKQSKHHYLKNGLEEDSLLEEDGTSPDRCYWTRLDWKFSVFERQQRLRLTISSRGKVIGGTVFIVEELMSMEADDKGVRRLTGELLGPDDDFAGSIQLSFHLDVIQGAVGHHQGSAQLQSQQPQQRKQWGHQQHMPPMFSNSLIEDRNNQNNDDDDNDNQRWGHTPQHVMEERRFSSSSQGAQYVFGAEPSVLSRAHSMVLSSNNNNHFSRNHTMDPVDADEQDRDMRQPKFPCVLLLRDLAALDLLPLQQQKSLLNLSRQKKQKNQGRVCIEVYAENFFQTTEVNNLDTDFHTFLHLNWSLVVQESSIVRLVVRDGRKMEIGHCDLTPTQLWAVPQNSAGVREVMLAIERDGLCSGKLIARAIFQNLSPLLISQPPANRANSQLSLQHLYTPGNYHTHGHNSHVIQAVSAGAGVIIDDHRFFGDSVSVSQSIDQPQISPNTQAVTQTNTLLNRSSNNTSNTNIISNNHNNSYNSNPLRPRSHSVQSQQSLLQPGNLLEHSVTSEHYASSHHHQQQQQQQAAPDIVYVTDRNGNNNHGNRPRLRSNGEESAITYDTVSPLQSRRSSVQTNNVPFIQPLASNNNNNNFYNNNNNNNNHASNNASDGYVYNNNNNNYNVRAGFNPVPSSSSSAASSAPHQNHPNRHNHGGFQSVTTRDILSQQTASPPASQPPSTSFFPTLFQRPAIGNSDNSNNHNTNNNNHFNVGSPVAGGGGSSLPSLAATLVLPDTLETPVRVVIRAIALIDLPRAHTFSANLPVCSLACGRFTAVLPAAGTNAAGKEEGGVSVTDGQTAAWDHLHISFGFDKGAQLRVHVTSKGDTIGICALSRARLLSGRRSAQSGAFVIVDELLPLNQQQLQQQQQQKQQQSPSNWQLQRAQYKAAGKLKLVYDLPDLALPTS